MPDVISLGAGVQSSTMALMAAKGEIEPMPSCAIFADTGDEPANVYAWLDWLEKQLPFPVHRVTRGRLMERCLSVRQSAKNNRLSFSGIPAHVRQPDGKAGLAPRQCTRDFKIDPITKAVNAVRREHGNTQAVLWIGISVDEIYRAKQHRNAPRIVNTFPLMDRRMNRHDCLKWMAGHSYPEPPRSACVYCPYHSNSEWHRLKTSEPLEFAKAVQFEKDFQASVARTPMTGVPFLHRSLRPLSEIDFAPDNSPDLFNNECEGMCGV